MVGIRIPLTLSCHISFLLFMVNPEQDHSIECVHNTAKKNTINFYNGLNSDLMVGKYKYNQIKSPLFNINPSAPINYLFCVSNRPMKQIQRSVQTSTSYTFISVSYKLVVQIFDSLFFKLFALSK